MGENQGKGIKVNIQDGRVGRVGAVITIFIWPVLMALIVFLTLRFCKKTA